MHPVTQRDVEDTVFLVALLALMGGITWTMWRLDRWLISRLLGWFDRRWPPRKGG